MTTLSSSLPRISAITFVCGLFTTATVAVVPAWASDSPAAKLTPTTGTLIVVKAEPAGGTAVMFVRVLVRSVGGTVTLPWLKRITAAAPAVCAFATLRAKLHPPRWTSAIRPATKPAKSLMPPGGAAVRGAPTAASVNAPLHPLVFARGGIRLMSIGVTAAVTVPRALPVTPPVACVATVGVSCRTGSATVKSNWCSSTWYPAASSFSTT